MSLKCFWLIVLGSIIDYHDGTTCKFLFSINFMYIHTCISFNFPGGRKAGIFFWFQYIPRSRDLPPPAQNCEKCESSPCLFHLCSRPSHSEWSQMEWTILDCGGAFPLHGEVMESSLALVDITQIYLTDCFWFNYGLSWWTDMSFFYFQSILSIFIFYEGRKACRFFLF